MESQVSEDFKFRLVNTELKRIWAAIGAAEPHKDQQYKLVKAIIADLEEHAIATQNPDIWVPQEVAAAFRRRVTEHAI